MDFETFITHIRDNNIISPFAVNDAIMYSSVANFEFVEFSPDGSRLSAFIELDGYKSWDCTIYLDQDITSLHKSSFYGKCSCGKTQGLCAHMASLFIYYFENQFLFDDPLPYLELEKKKGKYHLSIDTIPEDGYELNYDIYIESVNIEIIAPDTFHVKGYKKSYLYWENSYDLILEGTIKLKDGEFIVTIENTITAYSADPEDKAEAVIDLLLQQIELSKWKKGNPVLSLLDHLGKKYNKDLRWIYENFSVYLYDEELKMLPHDDSFSRNHQENLENTLEEIQDVQENTSFLNRSEKLRNAFLFLRKETDGKFLTPLEGELAMSGKKLKGKIEVVDNALHFPPDIEKFYLKHKSLRKLARGKGENKQKILVLLKESIIGLNKQILYYSKATQELYFKNSELVDFKFNEKTVTAELKAFASEEGNYGIEFMVYDDTGKQIDISRYTILPYFMGYGKQAFIYDDSETALLCELFKGRKLIQYFAFQKEKFFNTINRLNQITEIQMDPSLNLERDIIEQGGKEVYLEESGDYVLFTFKYKTSEHTFNILTESRIISEDKSIEIEQNIVDDYRNFIRSLHPEFDKEYFIRDFLYLSMDTLLDNLWFLEFAEACKAANIELYGKEKLKSLNYSMIKPRVKYSVSSGIDWFDVDVSMAFGNEQIEQKDWWNAIRNNERYVKLGNGKLGLIPEEWFNRLKRLTQVAQRSKNDIQISKFKFNIIDELFEEISDEEILQEIREKKKALLNYDTSKKHQLPQNITASLRDYQKQGFNWLSNLHDIQWGGILADDMGLGKTLQVISLLTKVHAKAKKPSLIILPRSLMFNWEDELKKFSDKLKYLIHYGPERKVDEKLFSAYDLIITTYTIATNDIYKLKDMDFTYVVLDESQFIKNMNSQRFKACCLLNADNRICMTGTPIENNTFELFSQMHFLNPGMLGSQKSFKETFAIPIDKYGDKKAGETLSKMISPFMLRRTKEVVAKDLPEKTESIIYCEMAEDQKRVYNGLKQQIRNELISGNAGPQAKFKILEGLLRLRQACNSASLIEDKIYPTGHSIKIETLVKNLREEIHNHSALIFSQFVQFLDLIRDELDRLNIPYAYLDGSTRDRKGAVAEFNENEDVKIFLISLKAGNTGLNLVKADYVYIMDPWWNPAVESQAIDRTHRIGQDKAIFAYKMVCKDTIEEKIITLQNKKKKIVKDIIGSNENFLASLSKDELMNLFD